MRIPEFLAENHVAYETLVHPPAYSAQKRAKYLHVPGHQVVKAVLLYTPEGYYLAVLPATKHIDTLALAPFLPGPIALASDEQIAKIFHDCEWGVVEPFGSLYGVSTILEDSIEAESQIVFENHTHGEAVRMRCRDFEVLERPRRLHFATI
jgi:Ala-tRNA(Pro) deacylase